MQLSVVILAAGQGKRMHSDLPKVLQPLAGKPLLAHVIETAQALEPTNIYVVYGHGGAAVQAALEPQAVDWVLQAQQLGTGHAVMQAMPLIPDDHQVLILYGDVPLIRAPTLRALLTACGTDGLAILSAEPADAAGYGRILRAEAADGGKVPDGAGADDAAPGAIIGIVEHKDATPEQLRIREINTGLMAMPARRLRHWLAGLRNDNAQREYYLTDVVAAAVRDGVPVRAVLADEEPEIQGVNDKLQLAQVEASLRARRARELLLAGATLSDPARVDVRGRVTIGRDVSIDINVLFIGEVVLGARVKIGPNCILENASIGDDTEVHANSVIDRADVGQRCIVGPFARLRPGTVLGPGAHIGNFVEVKNSNLGAGSKANHLTYLGDADVGAGVNVGAGSVTCNYDGANKWRTTIEDGVFIGSGSMLVAPVAIGSNATIGAGSTITADAPAGQLTIARAKQITVEGWQRPTKQKPKA
jgi:bifunctional UDP-N-acetylglucosamine pyrophosphorylase/glucosamine-1-phosphate N-acetyltransferase